MMTGRVRLCPSEREKEYGCVGESACVALRVRKRESECMYL